MSSVSTWSKQPLFKVSLNKKRIRSIKIKTHKNNVQLKKQRSHQFIAENFKLKIPYPPTCLLRSIDAELRRIEIKKSIVAQDVNSLFNVELTWDEDNVLSDDDINDDIAYINYSSEEELLFKKSLNSFIAFRAYNAQFGNGLNQHLLSHLLSLAWHSAPEQHHVWDVFAQQFNFVKPKCGFVEWVGQTYEREWCTE
ncbi:hypothetical protein TPHA_0E04080 [Tetrapisispora phaffii CBS 4417]|uniref:Alpha box domain-containing protein n=1 Tax=Tetrapisispora phaffii (strain ATCC 24235 / CBS 4417 / NBRC 1672 / NRRL Y-8282 / UCD 70-5) TaxID=1071381 RepID=G8BUB7_TETPH|nr:hypothetical protein TPHA_0E03620 [Tetrapisispora phaffii CBS 4417]XP_003685929.1 hypothetical protein TPHA_0E04080 [Tetrapisispora phaffii CBS 4417]CCE63451.1 hypothetical protein TPHA_0E03620 [Tetrapisispora phaffii CBS 4417]CCE63495.1 hypothetical protein TPHA_0E04080 [Tetrapisispora phaffii CBS 4417]